MAVFVPSNTIKQNRFQSISDFKWCDTPDEMLEYMAGGDRLRDVITQVTVWDRTI